MDTKRGKQQVGRGGVTNWEIGIDMYTLMCIKWMTNKNLQYKKKIVGEAVYVGKVGGIWEFSVPSAQFCCEPNTDLNK